MAKHSVPHPEANTSSWCGIYSSIRPKGLDSSTRVNPIHTSTLQAVRTEILVYSRSQSIEPDQSGWESTSKITYLEQHRDGSRRRCTWLEATKGKCPHREATRLPRLHALHKPHCQLIVIVSRGWVASIPQGSRGGSRGWQVSLQ